VDVSQLIQKNWRNVGLDKGIWLTPQTVTESYISQLLNRKKHRLDRNDGYLRQVWESPGSSQRHTGESAGLQLNRTQEKDPSVPVQAVLFPV